MRFDLKRGLCSNRDPPFFNGIFCRLDESKSVQKQTKNRNETGSDQSLGERLMSVKTSKPQALL